MGAVDLVCQVASPGNVARGLQRVGRAGHLVGQKSEGPLDPQARRADLLEQAVLAREMAAGRIEAHPRADQLPGRPGPAAGGHGGDGHTGRCRSFYRLVRQRTLTATCRRRRSRPTLEMISGGRFIRAQVASGQIAEERTPVTAGPALGRAGAALQPRMSWDRVHNRSARPAGQPADGPGQRRHHPRHGPVCRLPAGGVRWASWMRSSSTNAGSATPSCSAPIPGGWSSRGRPRDCQSRRGGTSPDSLLARRTGRPQL